MNELQILLLLVVALPAAGSLVLAPLGRVSEDARNWVALLLVTAALICALGLVPLVLITDLEITVECLGVRFFSADRLAVFMSLVSLVVGAIIVLYSHDYIRHYGNRNEYYFMVVLFLGAMMGLVYAANLILLYVFWEITALASWRLIGFFREKQCVLRADKAFLVTVFGALLMLAGFIMIFTHTGSFDLKHIAAVYRSTPAADLAVALILVGILAKSATLPLHTWLPDAGVAPSPVTALLHAAVLVKIGVYVYARLFLVTIPVEPIWHTIVPLIAGVSALVSAGAALIETDIKRIIAFSTVSQIGFIFLGLSIGNEIGAAGGLLYILMHGLSKGGLFLCAGIVEQRTHEKDITKLGGLIKTMPITALSFLLCAFSVMGIPPFGGFFSKYMVIAGAVQSGSPLIAGIFLVGAFLTIMYLLRVFSLVFLGAPGASVKDHMPHEESRLMVGSVSALAALSLIGGILVYYPSAFVEAILRQIPRLY